MTEIDAAQGSARFTTPNGTPTGVPNPAPGPRPRALQRREQVAEDIKQLILRQRLRPGDPLPTEGELCDAVGASRSSVREAVKTLTALDIVEVRHGRGTYVGRMSMNALVESLAFRGLLNSADDHLVIAELVEVRQTLETGFADRIVSGLDDAHRARLHELAEEMRERADRGEEFIDLDRDFHLCFVEPLENDLLLQLTGAFWDVHAIASPTLPTRADSLVVTADLHRNIAAAVVSGDVAAVREAIVHHYQPIRELIARAGQD